MDIMFFWVVYSKLAGVGSKGIATGEIALKDAAYLDLYVVGHRQKYKGLTIY